MEIKSKLFTVIAQALDKLKKQFDNTDKSLAKTQTTLDATIVNIDNVVDSVARTMTEALDPYFVDMIYGYKDDNGKFKLGVIKDPWKDGFNNVIPSNMVYIYHWGDNEIFKTVTSYVTLFDNCKSSKMDVDFTMLFPNVNQLSRSFLALGSTFNKVKLDASLLKYKGKYLNGVIESCTINSLEIYGELDNYSASDILISGSHIKHLGLYNITKLTRNDPITGSLITNCSFEFLSTKDISGWDNIQEFYSLNLDEEGSSAPNNKLDTFVTGRNMTIIDTMISCWWIKSLFITEFTVHKRHIFAPNCKNLYLILKGYLNCKDNNISVEPGCKIHISNDNSYNSVNYIEINKDYVLDLSIAGYDSYGKGLFNTQFIIGQLVIPYSIINIGNYAFNFGFLRSVKLKNIDNFIRAACKSDCIWSLHTNSSIENHSIEWLDNNDLPILDINIENVDKISQSLFAKSKIQTVHLSSSVTTIDMSAFEGSDLKSINLENVNHISSTAFEDSYLEFADLSNVISIGNRAFKNTNIKELIIPDNYGQSDLPDGIAQGCNLNLMVIPAIITTSDSDYPAFDSCKKLYIKGDRVLDIEDRFGRADVVYVPNSVLNRYKTHSYWKNQADKIFPYDFELNPDNI